jgi:general secretion pathway protein G
MSYDGDMNQLKNKPVLSTAVRASRGFTLVEILIVLALIGMIAGLAISNLGGIFSGSQEDTAKMWIDSTAKTALTVYRTKVGKYPASLSDLRNPPNGVRPIFTKDSDLKDPWGKEWVYKEPGTRNPDSYDLSTTTPDGKVIGNWDGN